MIHNWTIYFFGNSPWHCSPGSPRGKLENLKKKEFQHLTDMNNDRTGMPRAYVNQA